MPGSTASWKRWSSNKASHDEKGLNMPLLLLAQVRAGQAGEGGATDLWIILPVVGAIAVVIVVGILLWIFFSFVRLWIQALLTGARVGIFDLIGMKLRNVDYNMIVRNKIA